MSRVRRAEEGLLRHDELVQAEHLEVLERGKLDGQLVVAEDAAEGAGQRGGTGGVGGGGRRRGDGAKNVVDAQRRLGRLVRARVDAGRAGGAGLDALGVDLHVPVQVELEDERLGAQVAGVVAAARVDHQVLREVALLEEGLVAVRAHMGSVASSTQKSTV